MHRSLILWTLQRKRKIILYLNYIYWVTAHHGGHLLEYVLTPSQNISIYRLSRFMFDHSSYSKNLWKYYLFCYDMFYHRIYFKYIIIVFTFFINFLNKTNGQTWIAEVDKCLYFGTEGVFFSFFFRKIFIRGFLFWL